MGIDRLLSRVFPSVCVVVALLLLTAPVSADDAQKAPGGDASGSPKKAKPKFELKDGDRVVFLGNTLIEREQKYGYWETMLTARYPDRKILFRNLGWDGDTVWAESRGLFDPPEKGYARMLAHVGRIKPTVLFLGYGNNEAFAGKAGLPRFVKQYNKLLDDLTRVSAKGVRFVLLSPTLHQDPREIRRIAALFKEPAAKSLKQAFKPNAHSTDESSLHTKRYNRSAALYSKSILSLARKRGAVFIDLANATPGWGWTSNGMHLSKDGYALIAADLSDSLGIRFPNAAISVDLKDGKITHIATDNATARFNPKSKRIRFRAAFRFLPADMARWGALDRYTIVVEGLPVNQFYSLKINGTEVAYRHSGTGGRNEERCYTWRSEVPILTGPDFKQLENLRQAIIAKNRLYFHSWRPQNVTYLFLFRKHEQGQNAKEMKEFERLVAAKEKEIDRLKKPVTRTYELVRVKAKKN